MRRPLRLWLVLLLISTAAWAHVGSKDVFERVDAGPYTLNVTIRMPTVIPAVATVEVRSTGARVSSIDITPLPLTGEGAKHPPTADALQADARDPAFFTGGVWMMSSGSWQVRFDVNGPAGRQRAAVPVPAVALSTLTMDHRLGVILAILGLLLVTMMAGIVAAAVGEARLEPGVQPTPVFRRRARIATIGSVAVMLLLVWGGAAWWNADAASYARDVYRPLAVRTELSGNQLQLDVRPYKAQIERRSRANDDFIPDHGHLMHLYAIREPAMDAVFHLHPQFVAAGEFRLPLPQMPAGTYKLYGDVVHANGFPETLVTSVAVPAGMAGAPLAGDDAAGSATPVSAPALGHAFTLPDHYTMVWDAPATLTANTAYVFRFRLLAPNGEPAADMRPYMGMGGHAAFVKTDGSVFAHVHPEGSAAMAAMMMANPMPGMPDMSGMGSSDMGSNNMGSITSGSASSTVEFPYGFPSPGRYRIIVQMKHGETVETGVFDAVVS